MNAVRRFVYQFRRWLFLRSVRECKRCDGTGMEVVGYYDANNLYAAADSLSIVGCRACAGDGWLPK